MAKRKTEEMLAALKKKKTEDGAAAKLSDTAFDPRTSSWTVTSFPKNKARIYTWNINGLNAVMGRGDLEKFLKQEDPDVLCLNETKMDESKIASGKIKEKLFPDKYLQYWNCCKSSSGYAGTAILTKVKPLEVKYDLGIMEHDLEGRTLTAEFEHFILVACYVPNAGQKLDRLSYRTKKWDVDFRRYLKNLETSKNKCVILCGDLNVAHHEIDISNPKGNLRSAGFTVEERTEFTNFLNEGFVDSFRKYTYWNLRSGARASNKGWRLDYFAISEVLMDAVEESDMLSQVMGSDHCPIKLVLDLPKVKNPGTSAKSASPVTAVVEIEKGKKEDVATVTTTTAKTEKKTKKKIEKKVEAKEEKKKSKAKAKAKGKKA